MLYISFSFKNFKNCHYLFGSDVMSVRSFLMPPTKRLISSHVGQSVNNRSI